MKRVCTGCQTVLGYECDHCESVNCKPSRITRGQMNCGNCFKTFREDSSVMRAECVSCLTRDIKARHILDGYQLERAGKVLKVQ